MNTITSLNRTAANAPTPAPAANSPATGATGTAGSSAASLVALSGDAPTAASKGMLWENRFHSSSSYLMANNFQSYSGSARLKGLGGELLKQVAYDGADFSQSVQAAPDGVKADTYDMLVSPTAVAQHGLGDNKVALTITTRSGVKVELTVEAGDTGIAVQAKSDGKLNEAERKALGKLSDAFQQAIDGMSEDPPRIDLAGLTQFDSFVLSSVDLKGQVKVDGSQMQNLEFHADAAKRSVSFAGPAGSAKIAVDLSQPAAWGSKEQQAKALHNYLDQVDQANTRGQGKGVLQNMFKDAFTDMNSDYGTQPVARGVTLTDQDRAFTTGLADFSASMSQTEVASNPARITEKDTFSYELSQKTTISGKSQLDRGISQQQQSHLKAQYHAPVSANATLALDLNPQSQNYKYITIDDSASSSTSIAYDKGVLAKARLDMDAHQSMRVLTYSLGKLKDDAATPYGKTMSQDLIPILEPERLGQPALTESQRAQTLASINDKIFLRSNPDALPNERT
ncbi:hypothetical protein [Duganella callida]|uniref:Lactate dehydrogenase n=1 Tax=Duganella callida TaxID=2561932 RepID=A0A4Y9SQU4_9BURK|nr:hypothetical protein [Duganella callida]TFW29030.1 hypothetical protein E4L98_04590 [Duganella callida]